MYSFRFIFILTIFHTIFRCTCAIGGAEYSQPQRRMHKKNHYSFGTLWYKEENKLEKSKESKMNFLFKNRHSGRSYDTHKLVTINQLKELIEAARWASSCFGEEPWRYIICIKNTNPEAYGKIFSCLDPANQAWAENAPILMLSVACETFSKNQKYNRWAQHDTGAASISLALEAVDLGLMVHQMGGFDAQKAKELFQIPEDCVPMAVIAVGYEAENALDKNAPRSRKVISDHFFEGKWGVPIKGF